MYNSFENDFERVSAKNTFIAKTYGWMFLALLVSGATAFFTSGNYALLKLAYSTGFYIGSIIAELAIVFILSARINRISPFAAGAAFLVYSLLNGFNLSFIFIIYTGSSIIQLFGICAAMFLIMAFYGKHTSTDLSSWGKYLSMALIGLVIATAVNFFMHSSGLDYIICYAGVILFTILTAYDIQKMYRLSDYADGSEMAQKATIVIALNLYLDFINIFLYILRLFGKRR